MVIRFGGIALACLVALPTGQTLAQERDPFPPRRVYVEPYPEDLPPGYYRRVPRRYYRLPPGYYDDDDAVVIRRRGVYSGVGVASRPPFVRYHYRVTPDPSDDDLRRPYVRRSYPDPIQRDDRGSVREEPWREGHATLPPESDIDARALPPIGERDSAALPRGGLPSQSGTVPDERVGPSSAAELPPRLRRQIVDDPTGEPAGTIVVDTGNTYLYYVLGDGKAMRYGIGVGREGFGWSGRERISRMAEWPDWYPPKEMIAREPHLPRMMAGGPGNPLGARALYLGNTLYRIHGTSDASSIGRHVSSGCIRMLNEDVIDLYKRAKVGTQVVVLRSKRPPSGATARR